MNFYDHLFVQVMHSFAGLVKANPMTTLAQVYSRLFVVWAVADGVPGVRIHMHTENLYTVCSLVSWEYKNSLLLIFLPL